MYAASGTQYQILYECGSSTKVVTGWCGGLYSECECQCVAALLEEMQYLRSQLEGDREQHLQQLAYLSQQNQTLAENTHLQLDL